MQRQFALFDTENRGTLPKDKIKQIMESELTPREQVDLTEALNKLAKRSKKIDYHQFMMLVVEKNELLCDENLKKTFAALDLDKKGHLTVADLQAAF